MVLRRDIQGRQHVLPLLTAVKQVQNLLSTGESKNPEEGLFRIGTYYHNNQRFRQSVGAFKRYLIHYPNGRYAGEAEEKIEYGEGMFSNPDSYSEETSSSKSQVLSFPEAMEYYETIRTI